MMIMQQYKHFTLKTNDVTEDIMYICDMDLWAARRLMPTCNGNGK